MSSKNGGRKKKDGTQGVIAENRRARRDYEVIDTLEAGLMLQGTEVKSLRVGKANLEHSYASFEKGEPFLLNADIPEYATGNRFNHKPTRPRKLLMHRREANRLMASVQRDGMTIVPLKLYFNDNGLAKLLVGLARGRKKADKREHEKTRDWDRDKARLLRDRG
ncbi:SsrA-binding protein SmpB [Alphaproteobacteria bacterium]|nr:SsrA-binding protein SmpB [Alphaproteobacteria bacterium]